LVESFSAFLSFLANLISPQNPVGLLSLFALAVVTDIGIPAPFVLDTVLILTSYQSGPLSLPVLLTVVALFTGRQLGSAILYLLSRLLGKAFIHWLQRHFPKLGEGLESLGRRLSRWAVLAVATGRLTPGLLQITSVAAGTIRLPYYQFALGIAISSIIYDGLLVILGFIAANSPKSSDINFTFWMLIAILIIICVLWPLLFFLLRRSSKKSISH
jgi:membrane protein DedA with SNARE-associated domain